MDARGSAEPRKTPWSMCLWPGLAPLWVTGQWSGLAWAIGFALILNAALVSTWIWTELAGPTFRLAAWCLTAAVWLASALMMRAKGSAFWAGQASESSEDLFRRLTSEYLMRNWLEAERVAKLLLARNTRDVEARLSIASLYRHTGRHGEARQQLNEMERLDGAAGWAMEIAFERRELDNAAADDTLDEEDNDSATQEPSNRVMLAA